MAPTRGSSRRLVSPTGKTKVLPPVRPNAGIEAAYRRRLDALIAEMNASVLYWIRAQYRENPPELATDESPASGLQAEMASLGVRWQRRFDEAAPEIARHFAKAGARQADGSLRSILKKAGFTVEFHMTRAANDVMQATIAEQVGLIQSIPQQYLTQVQGAVMRSVTTGRDLGTLTKEIEGQFGVTRRRAAFIARDQNNKASASMTRVRQQELGIDTAKWLHSAGGKHPREEHVAFSKGKNGGPFYEVSKGAFLEGKWTWPGVEPGCRCVSRAVLQGFE